MRPPLKYSSSENAVAGFGPCIELVDALFGKTARDLNLKGHSLEVSFGLHYGRITSIGAKTEDESAYHFKWIPPHQTLCANLTKALQGPLERGAIHSLGFKMESYGVWSIGQSKNKAQGDRDKFNESVNFLETVREDWFKNFIQQDEIFSLKLTYPSMPRPFGPFWPANRFGFLIGRTEKYLWVMSTGLSAPLFPSEDHDWESSQGVGCEILVRCAPDKIDLTAGTMSILNTPEMIILDSLCATIINMHERKEFDIVTGTQVVGLEYYKHTPIRPLPIGTKFALTNASSFDICKKIPSLGPFQSRPLIATQLSHSQAEMPVDEISRHLIDLQNIGVLGELSKKPDIGI